MHPLASALNAILAEGAPHTLRLLSVRGKDAYFPVSGVLSQGAEAAGKCFNATIGIATEDDGTAMSLAPLREHIALPPGEVFPYSGAYGEKALRQQWLSAMREKNPQLHGPVSLPVVTAGLTHALWATAELFLDSDTSVLLPEPYWDNYDLTLAFHSGAKLEPFPLFSSGGFNMSGLRTKLQAQSQKVTLFLNFPNNPTGYTPLLKEAEEICGAVHETAERGADVLVILDDAYFGFVYEEGVLRDSLFARMASLHEHVLAVKVDGISKEDCAWGLRVGFLTFGGKGMTPQALAALEDKTAGMVRSSVSNASHLSQSVILHAMSSPRYAEEKRAKFVLLSERYHEARQILGEPRYCEAFRLLPCNSGYFLCIELRPGVDAEGVRQALLQDFDTGVVSLGNRMIRIAYSSIPKRNLRYLFKNVRLACERCASPMLLQDP